MVVVVVVAVLVAAVAAAIVVTRDEEGEDVAAIGRGGSTVVRDAPDIDPTRTVNAVRVVYRVETGGTSISVVTDTLSTRRPFESRLETLSGAPPGKGTPTARVGWFLGTATVTGGNEPAIIEVAPGPPPTDLRLEHSLPEGVARGAVERREVRAIAGRRCQVFRTRETLAAPMRPPGDENHVDSCIDETGTVLEEVVTVDRRVLTRRVAVDVEENPTLADSLFAVQGTPLPAHGGGGFVRKVKAGTAPPGEFFVLDNPPDGFEYVGRYSVVPPQPENFSGDPTREDFRRAGVVDLWRRGVDLVTVDQGGTLRGAEPFPPVEGAPSIDVPPFGTAELLLSGTGVELRLTRAGGRYVRVAGTVPVAVLLDVAARLRATEGSALELEP